MVFREALYREEVPRDPTAGVGKVKYRQKERGVFAAQEIRRLYPDHDYGPWRDTWDCTCFYLAAVTGLRRGEILALRWQHIGLERQCVAVCEAWKGGKEMGPPKWDHLRVVPIGEQLKRIQGAVLPIRGAAPQFLCRSGSGFDGRRQRSRAMIWVEAFEEIECPRH
ncbi:MAG: tyrosine-type recombinase/integrase [Spirochaetales bacterium]|nr:tyrosine-type recombinase/integrase [Spirochaetales bacterium]